MDTTVKKNEGFSGRLRRSATRTDALLIFFEALEAYGRSIDVSKAKMEAIFAHETPQAPYFEYAVTEGFTYEPSRWVETKLEDKLDHFMQSTIETLEELPEFDFVPALGIGSWDSGLISRMMGSDLEGLPDGGTRVRQYAAYSSSEALALPPVDAASHPYITAMADEVGFFMDLLGGRVDFTYPQMQGPLTNIMRIIPQETMLMESVTDPESMGELAGRVGSVTCDIIEVLTGAAGVPGVFRPRGRFYQPGHIRGLYVDDYLSVIRPGDYLSICAGAWKEMADRIGPIFFHTCGPVLQAIGMMKKLPGLRGFETCFVDGQHKRTRDLEAMKAACGQDLACFSFGLPFGEPVEDMDRLTPEWLAAMSRDGGFAMQAHGSLENGRRIASRILDVL